MEIENLITRATVKETADITGNVCTMVENSVITDEYLGSITSELKTLSEQMLKGISSLKGKKLSEELQNADEIRDNLLTTLNYFVKAYVQWNKPETIDAASKVEKIIATQGVGMAWLSYEEESASLDALLTKFEEVESKAAIETISQTTLVGELKEAQNNFKLLYQQSAISESTKKSETIVPSLVKKAAIQKLNVLINYMNVMSQANSGIYGSVAATVAEMVNSLNGKIRTRHTNKTDNDETAE